MSEDSPVAALVALYESADADVVRRGRDWYNAARAECAAISADSGYTLEQVAAVMAITSPAARLSTNIRWTREFCESRGKLAKVGRYPGRMTPASRAALAADDPAEHVVGPKVSAFYLAILGDESAAVIDRWAAFAAGHENRERIPEKIRRIVEAAYREAAALVGETVAAFQAIVWTVIRETTMRSDGRPQGLTDITA